MLTIPPAARRKRPVIVGPPEAPTGAMLVVDDSWKLYRFFYDEKNAAIEAYFERGYTTPPPERAFVGSGEVFRVVLDGHDHQPEPEKRNTFGQVASAEIQRAIDAIERVVRQSGLLPDVA
jgi:hypothetical protein